MTLPLLESIVEKLQPAIAAREVTMVETLTGQLLEEGRAEIEAYRIDSGLAYCNAALDASTSIADLRGIALARSYIAIAHSMVGDFPSAMEHVGWSCRPYPEGFEASSPTRRCGDGPGRPPSIVGQWYTRRCRENAKPAVCCCRDQVWWWIRVGRGRRRPMPATAPGVR